MYDILNEEFCQRLSQSASLIIGRHVLVTNADGIILGSNDPRRVGTLHEASLSVIASGRQHYHDISAADSLTGTKPGTTIPLFLGGTVVGSIGITGAPREISKYASLIQQLAQTFLEFQEKQRSSQYSDYEKLALLHELATEVSDAQAEAIENTAYKMGYDLHLSRVVIRIEMESLQSEESLVGPPLSKRVVEHLERSFANPQNFICIHSRTEVAGLLVYSENSGGMEIVRQKIRDLMDAFTGECSILRISVGAPMTGAKGMHASYQDAALALRVMRLRDLDHGSLTACDIFLEKLALSLNDEVCQHVESTLLRNVQDNYEKEQLMLMIQHWCQTHFNFSKTAEALHIHKSTLVYRFRRTLELYELDLYDFDKTMALYLMNLRHMLQSYIS